MHTNFRHRLIIGLFCGYLGVMALLYLCLPREEFSQLEKRYLAQPPVLTWESLTGGDFSDEVDTFLSDHIPGRSFFVGLNAWADLISGRQGSKDILLTRDSRLVEAPATANGDTVAKNMALIHTFAEGQSIPVDLMLVPSAGWAAEDSITGIHDSYADAAIIHGIYAATELPTVDILSAFTAEGQPEAYYYRTDHHWNSLGAHTAYGAYMTHLGRDFRPAETFRVETISGFRGSTYSRSGLWQISGEALELWHGSDTITVTHEESQTPHSGVFFRERLTETDKYTVYLDGNHALVRLENPQAAGGGKLLVVRDSFCNSLGGFLSESFETVVLADLRYYRQSLSELIAQEGFDRVLICYSLNNFLTDTNIVWLR